MSLHYFVVPMVHLGTNRLTQFTVLTPEEEPRNTVITLRNKWNQHNIASLSYLVSRGASTGVHKMKGLVLILYRYPKVNTVSRAGTLIP